MLTAKRLGCPVVVVNAITSEEERSFPYLGNTPSLRWEPQGADRARDVLDMALREVLRATYMRFHLRSLQRMEWIPAQAELQPRLPKVITCLAPSALGASSQGWSTAARHGSWRAASSATSPGPGPWRSPRQARPMIFLVLKGLSRLPEPGRPALPA
ncbi:hypothetical protein KYC5002_13115 [Archangium violaceum]|uniref:hypothetical protein n=1 Tax=Archangium violaceum TaxID=83451 RepID=UPI002B31834D|nr:hypothetical protein KYC5002_13115 [Archangium gephyra]